MGPAHPWNWCEECALPVAIPEGAPDGTFVTCSICAAVYAVTLLQGCEFILEPRKPDPAAGNAPTQSPDCPRAIPCATVGFHAADECAPFTDGQPLGVAVRDIAAGENVIAGSMVAPVQKAVP